MIPRTITADFNGANILLDTQWGLDTWHSIVRTAVKWDAILILQNFRLQ